jgi:hypothetical protein
LVLDDGRGFCVLRDRTVMEGDRCMQGDERWHMAWCIGVVV